MRCERPIDISVKTGGDLIKVAPGKPFIGRASYMVPCGKCFACLSRRKSQATFRMDCEKRFGHVVKQSDGTEKVVRFSHAFFISLSYADEFLPYDWNFVDMRTGECIEVLPRQDSPVLAPYHLQLFFKRLRRYYPNYPFVYYAVGEYGSDNYTCRPHYHLIFYSDMNWQQTREAFRHCWSVECPKSRIGSPGHFKVYGKYETHRLSMGRVDVKAVNMRRIRYCAKYIVKDMSNSFVVPKFARLSKGLGSGFLRSQQAKDIRRSRSLYAFSVDGAKCSLGRYYTHRLYTKSELSDLVRKYVDEDSAPLDIEPCTEESRFWYEEHILNDTIRYRAWKANQKNPLLIYL